LDDAVITKPADYRASGRCVEHPRREILTSAGRFSRRVLWRCSFRPWWASDDGAMWPARVGSSSRKSV